MSEQIKDGGSAFPWTRDRGPQEAMNSITSGPGMSLRDYFASKALPSMVKICRNDTLNDGESLAEHFAENAYAMADAMIAAREAKS